MQKIIQTSMTQEMRAMIKKIAWNTFKNTGNIDTFLELREVENIEKILKAEKNGTVQNKGIDYSREPYERL